MENEIEVLEGIAAEGKPDEPVSVFASVAEGIFRLKSIAAVRCGESDMDIADALEDTALLPALLHRAGEIWSEISGEANPAEMTPEAGALQGFRIKSFGIECPGIAAFFILDVVEELRFVNDATIDMTPLFENFDNAMRSVPSPSR